MSDAAKLRFAELKDGGVLPSPRGIAMAVLDMTGRPDASIHEITYMVRTDPAMAGRILHYANAANGGALRHIVSLQHAISFLGLFRVRQIVLGFSLIERYRSGICHVFDYEKYWTTSLATAIAAQRLAGEAQSPPDESFTCGLLSGIGRLALATVFPKRYGEVLKHGLPARELLEAERAEFGIDHAELSGEMLANWGLPDIFATAVRHHEFPLDAPCAPGTRAHALMMTLNLSARIGNLLIHDEAQRWEMVPSLFNAAAQIGLEADAVPPLVEEVVAGWHDWARELKLPTKNYSDLGALLASPPARLGDENGATPLSIIPLRVALIVADAERKSVLAARLTALGLRIAAESSAGEITHLDRKNLPDIMVIDLHEAIPQSLQELHAMRVAVGSALHMIALIAPEAESRVPQLLGAGASDYLLYNHSEAALVARLVNAQQLVSLFGAVRTGRELTVSSSRDWARANRRLLHDALTDVLTQLPNRRYGLDRFAQEWSIAASNGLPIACMMLDIDHFKRVNDEHGHDVGDLVLRQMATTIASCFRRSDIVFRYGGEEFCCICPSTAIPEGLHLAERLLAAVRAGSFGPAEAPFPVTLSIGLAVCKEGFVASAELIAQADRALYAAKAGGRNRVVASKTA